MTNIRCIVLLKYVLNIDVLKYVLICIDVLKYDVLKYCLIF